MELAKSHVLLHKVYPDVGVVSMEYWDLDFVRTIHTREFAFYEPLSEWYWSGIVYPGFYKTIPSIDGVVGCVVVINPISGIAYYLRPRKGKHDFV